ncbi:MAG TPA: hypothetical protein VEY30_11575, partial [Myxococcaceae bacterium]|nr:hypothetical protein [Myxococcaceae bacterium]
PSLTYSAQGMLVMLLLRRLAYNLLTLWNPERSRALLLGNPKKLSTVAGAVGAVIFGVLGAMIHNDGAAGSVKLGLFIGAALGAALPGGIAYGSQKVVNRRALEALVRLPPGATKDEAIAASKKGEPIAPAAA